MGVTHEERAEQGDRADHQGGDAEARRPLALERGQIARAEQAQQADQSEPEPEQAADQAQRPLPATPEAPAARPAGASRSAFRLLPPA